MQWEQLSFLNPDSLYQSHPFDLRSNDKSKPYSQHIDSSFPHKHIQPINSTAQPGDRQQALEHLLEEISQQDLPGKKYVEHYLRHKYRHNCKARTLMSTTGSLMQFLSFFRTSGKSTLEQLSRGDFEAFVEDNQRVVDNEKALAGVNRDLSKLVDLVLEGKIREETVKAKEDKLYQAKETFEDALEKDRKKLDKLPDVEIIRKKAGEMRSRLLHYYGSKERVKEMTYEEKRDLFSWLFPDGVDEHGQPYGVLIKQPADGIYTFNVNALLFERGRILKGDGTTTDHWGRLVYRIPIVKNAYAFDK